MGWTAPSRLSTRALHSMPRRFLGFAKLDLMLALGCLGILASAGDAMAQLLCLPWLSPPLRTFSTSMAPRVAILDQLDRELSCLHHLVLAVT
eukprot:10562051-Karenia_brevis.AAC.1